MKANIVNLLFFILFLSSQAWKQSLWTQNFDHATTGCTISIFYCRIPRDCKTSSTCKTHIKSKLIAPSYIHGCIFLISISPACLWHILQVKVINSQGCNRVQKYLRMMKMTRIFGAKKKNCVIDPKNTRNPSNMCGICTSPIENEESAWAASTIEKYFFVALLMWMQQNSVFMRSLGRFIVTLV